MKTKTKSKVWTPKKFRKECDTLFSTWVRSIGFCEHCGKRGQVQCAHVYSRRNLHLRYEGFNAVSLCYACHMFWAHKEPIEFTHWFDHRYPGRIAWLEKEKNTLETDFDWPGTYARLKKQVENL